jgi:hypothetical protein
MKEQQEIKTDPEFSSLIPPISEDEFKELEESIKREGSRDALVVYKGSILDGHNRYKICQEHKIDFKTIEVPGIKNRDEAMLWIIRNQLGRRNLTTWQKALLALKLKPLIEKEALKRQKGGKVVLKSEQGRTIEKVAEIAGVSKDTIWKVDNIHNLIEKGQISESIKENLETGRSSINEVHKKLKNKVVPGIQLELEGIKEPTPITELVTNVGAKARSLTNNLSLLNSKIQKIKIERDDNRFWNAKFFYSLIYLYQELEWFRTGEELDDQEAMDKWKDWLPESSKKTPPSNQMKEEKK